MKLRREKNRLIDFLTILIVFGGLIYLIISMIFNYRIVQVSGNSMFPNLKDGQVIKITRPIWVNNEKLKRGQIIVFNSNNVDPRTKSTEYVKRIIGVPGDKVSFDGKNLYVNNKKIKDYVSDQETIQSKAFKLSKTFDDKTLNKWDINKLSFRQFSDGTFYWNEYSVGKSKVPEGMYFVLGDNRKISNDSREFGFVPAKSITGLIGN